MDTSGLVINADLPTVLTVGGIGEINGALAVAGPVDRIPVHEDDQAALAALVIAAANQISYEFGWLGPDQQ